MMHSILSSQSIPAYATEEQHSISTTANTSKITRFMNWCASQEERRMLWLALTFIGLIGMAVPCTLASVIMLAHNNFTLWIIVCTVNVPVLAINLAAQPTKITVPALLLAYSIDLLTIFYCIGYFLMH